LSPTATEQAIARCPDRGISPHEPPGAGHFHPPRLAVTASLCRPPRSFRSISHRETRNFDRPRHTTAGFNPPTATALRCTISQICQGRQGSDCGQSDHADSKI
jgi:hypothetical protein